MNKPDILNILNLVPVPQDEKDTSTSATTTAPTSQQKKTTSLEPKKIVIGFTSTK